MTTNQTREPTPKDITNGCGALDLKAIRQSAEASPQPPSPASSLPKCEVSYEGLKKFVAAQATVVSLGYTYCGGERWKPPLGNPPDFTQSNKVHTYSSTQATTCACCGQHRHTPLHVEAMGGYVCLTCIDKKLCSLLGEFGPPKTDDPCPKCAKGVVCRTPTCGRLKAKRSGD